MAVDRYHEAGEVVEPVLGDWDFVGVLFEEVFDLELVGFGHLDVVVFGAVRAELEGGIVFVGWEQKKEQIK